MRIFFAALALLAAAQAEEPATLTIVVHDAAGQVLPFRGYLQSSEGRSITPQPALPVALRKAYDEVHFLAGGEVSCEVTPGRYALRVERGLEWQPGARQIDVTAGEKFTANILLHRWVDMNADGWYSGDMHIHRAPEEVVWSLPAEDLNFGANTVLWNENNLFERLGLPVPAEAMQRLSATRVVNVRAQETERLGQGWGAALFLGDFEPLPLPAAPFYPLTAQVCQEARVRGAHIDFEKPVWRDLAIAAPLGLVDSVGVVHNHFHPRALLPFGMIRDSIVPPPALEMGPRAAALYTLDLYYHLLNCGLRIPVSAGSASGVMPSWVGFERTYVRLREPFSGEAWLKALRAGNSFATNGPILFLEVEGNEPGRVVELESAQTPLRITAKARAREDRLVLLEVLHNGRVIATAEHAEGVRELRVEEQIEAGPGWIAARCFEPETETQIFAATSPVYLEHAGERGEVAESAAFYAEFIASLRQQARAERRFAPGDEEDTAMALLTQAEAFFNALRGNDVVPHR